MGEKDFEFGHKCPHCGGKITTELTVEASADYWGELHFVVEEEIKEAKDATEVLSMP